MIKAFVTICLLASSVAYAEMQTCVYKQAVMHEFGKQHMKNIAIKCKVLKTYDFPSGNESGFEKRLYIDCDASLRETYDLVYGHPLNFSKLWVPAEDCYKF
jgi:hypothetical protein